MDTAPPPSDGGSGNSTDESVGSNNEGVRVEGGPQGAHGNTDQPSKDQQEDDDEVGVAAQDSGNNSGAMHSPDDNDSSTPVDNDTSDYPERPEGWLHEYLLIYCLIGRPSNSEDPDLKTARLTSGPPNRPSKRKVPEESSSGLDGSSSCSGSMGNLDSTAIRTFVGAGEAQSRSKVKKEHAAVVQNVAQEAYRQQRLQQSNKIVKAVELLTASAMKKQEREEAEAAWRREREEAEAASRREREEEQAARNRKTARIADLKGRLDLMELGSPQYLSIRSAILDLYETPDSTFKRVSAPIESSSTAAVAESTVAGPATSSSGQGLFPPPIVLPGITGGGASGLG